MPKLTMPGTIRNTCFPVSRSVCAQTARVLIFAVLLCGVTVGAAHAKMIADTLVIFGALNDVSGSVNQEAIILYNPTNKMINLNGYGFHGRPAATVAIFFDSTDTIPAFGYFSFGDGDAAMIDSATVFPNINGTESFALMLGPITVDYWALETATATMYHGDKMETGPRSFANTRYFYRQPALVIHSWSTENGLPVAFGGGMINRPGLTDIFEDTRGEHEGWVNGDSNYTDRMVFTCTAPPYVRVGSAFAFSCSATVNFGDGSFRSSAADWEGQNYQESVARFYTGNYAWADITSSGGTLKDLSADSRFTNGQLANYSLSISDTVNDTIRITVSDAACTGYLYVYVVWDTVFIDSPTTRADTIGGRRSTFEFRLGFMRTAVCTVVAEYNSSRTGTAFDSLTFPAAAGGPDSTMTLTSDSTFPAYTMTWNVQTDLPDTRSSHVRLRLRCWNAATGAYMGDTTFDSICVSTVLADPADTPDARADKSDTVTVTWLADTYAKYFVVWRDTGWPPNDTSRFNNVIYAVYGRDSWADNLGCTFIDTSVGAPRADTYFLWYITAIDTYDNAHEYQYGYGESLGAEYISCTKQTISISFKDTILSGVFGIAGETDNLDSPIPGAAIEYQISLSNVDGYSPAYNVEVVDIIPANTDYMDSTTVVDTFYRFYTQTDIQDNDYTRLQTIEGDSILLRVRLPVLDAGDTARIRFKTIVH